MAKAKPGDTPQRCGFIALLGATNAGKSTLLNALVGAKIAAVTHKVQTTRARVRAIAIDGGSQIVLVDTPGIFEPKRTLDRAMVDAAWNAATDADVVTVLIDARYHDSPNNALMLAGLSKLGGRPVLIINKIDLVAREDLLAIAATLNDQHNFAETFMISALEGDGVADLKRFFASAVPEGPWLYPEDQIADVPMRQLAAEITREKLTLRLHDELPYASSVETESWVHRKDGSIRIEQIIYVQRDSQKGIVLGKGGQTVKQIGTEARVDIAEAVGAPVHLFLFVKVRRNWGEDPERYRAIGLDFPKN